MTPSRGVQPLHPDPYGQGRGGRYTDAEYGGTLPVVYGTARVGGTLVYLANLRPATVTVPGGFGEDLVFATGRVVDAVVAICELPVASVRQVYAGRDKYTDPARLITTDPGGSTQIVTSYDATPVPFYSLPSISGMAHYGICHWRACGLRLNDPQTTVPELSFEVSGRCVWAGAGANSYDAHPADVVRDLLTRAGIPSANIVTDTGIDGTAASSYRNLCTARSWFISLVDTATDKLDLVKTILQATDSEAVWYDGQLHILPYADQSYTGNGVSYAPYTTAVVLDGAQLLHEEDEDPVTVERTFESEVFNSIPISYQCRVQDYRTRTSEFIDPGHSSAYQVRRAPSLDLGMVISDRHALDLAYTATQRSLFHRNRFTFRLDKRWSLLTPMDLVNLSEATLGLTGINARITSIEEDEEGVLTVEAIEWPLGTVQVISLSPQVTDGVSSAVRNVALADCELTSVPDGSVTTRHIIDDAVTGPKILAGAIGSAHLADDAVTARVIADASITAQQLADQAITAAKVGFQVGGGNLCPNSSFEADSNGDGRADNWAAHSGVQANSWSLPTDSYHGVRSQAFRADGTAVSPRTYLETGRPGCQAGTKVVVTAWLKAEAGVHLYLLVKGYTAASGGTNTLDYGSQTVAADGTWQRLTVALAVDASGPYITPSIGMTGTPAAGTLVQIDAVQIEVGEVPSAYAPKTDEILPGTITAGMVGYQAGGGNLLPNSSLEVDTDGNGVPNYWASYNNSSGTEPITSSLQTGGLYGGQFYRATWAANNTSVKGLYTNATIGGAGGVAGGWRSNVWYMLSWYARASGTNIGQAMRLGWNRAPNDSQAVTNPPLSASWQRYVFRIRWTTNPLPGNGTGQVGELYISIALNSLTQGDLDLDAIQVEEGETPSAYSPKADEILPGTVGSTHLAAGAVTTAKLATDSVQGACIAAGAITSTKIADDSISTTKLQVGAVTAGKIAAGAITANEIAANAITSSELATGAVTTAKLAAGAITANELAAGSVTTAKLTANAVTANELAAGAVTAGKIAANAITANELAANAITAGKIQAGAVGAAAIAAGAISADKFSGNIIKTANYTFSGTEGTGTEVATAGAKMQSAAGGSALLVAPGNLKIGSTVLRNLWFANWAVAAGKVTVTNSASGTSPLGTASYSGQNLMGPAIYYNTVDYGPTYSTSGGIRRALRVSYNTPLPASGYTYVTIITSMLNDGYHFEFLPVTQTNTYVDLIVLLPNIRWCDSDERSLRYTFNIITLAVATDPSRYNWL